MLGQIQPCPVQVWGKPMPATSPTGHTGPVTWSVFPVTCGRNLLKDYTTWSQEPKRTHTRPTLEGALPTLWFCLLNLRLSWAPFDNLPMGASIHSLGLNFWHLPNLFPWPSSILSFLPINSTAWPHWRSPRGLQMNSPVLPGSCMAVCCLLPSQPPQSHMAVLDSPLALTLNV